MKKTPVRAGFRKNTEKTGNYRVGTVLGSTFCGKTRVSVGSMSTRGSYCSFAGVLDRLATHGNTVLTTKRRTQVGVVPTFLRAPPYSMKVDVVERNAEASHPACTAAHSTAITCR